jgi:hypothetical protein
LTLLLALSLFLQPPSATSKVTKEVVTVQEVTVESAPFTAEGDNAPILNAFLDSLPAGSTVTLPAGVWPIKSPVQVNKTLVIESAANWPATLKLVASNKDADVMRVGTYGVLAVHGVTLRRLTLEVAGEKATGQMQCLEVSGNDFTAENVTLIGSPHEGVVVHGGYKDAKLTDCKAIDCGRGNEFYWLPTAGFNSHAKDTIYTRCKTKNTNIEGKHNGQGFEIDAHGTKALWCECDNDVKGGSGFNIGSTGSGIWSVEIAYCVTRNCSGAASFGNGIGRLASVHIHHNVFFNGVTSAMGGELENKVVTDPVSPDTGHSIIEHNVYVSDDPNLEVLSYNTGPDPVRGPVWGREPVTFADNTIIYTGTAAQMDSPLMSVGGNVTAQVRFLRNRLIGFDAPRSRGDLATYSNNQNKAIPGQPNLTYEGNIVVRKDGTIRPLVVNIEGK